LLWKPIYPKTGERQAMNWLFCQVFCLGFWDFLTRKDYFILIFGLYPYPVSAGNLRIYNHR
jgi:hypothetical protein